MDNLVTQTLECSRKKRPNRLGKIYLGRREASLHSEISVTMLARTLEIWRQLNVVLKNRNCHLIVENTYRNFRAFVDRYRTLIVIEGEAVPVYIHEVSRRYLHQGFTYYRPSGQLSFMANVALPKHQKKWTDRKGAPLELQIDSIVNGLSEISRAQSAYKVERRNLEVLIARMTKNGKANLVLLKNT